MTAPLSTSARRVALASALAVLLAVIDVVGAAGSIALVVAAAVAGWRVVPGFWRHVGRGAVSGLVAGLVLLGPGLRIAMRIVALADPLRTPELTFAGTAMIIVMVGGLFGAALGVIAALLALGSRLATRGEAAVITVVVMALFLTEPSLRTEFTTLGAGPWINIPLFTVVVLVYALAAGALRGRLAHRAAVRSAAARPVVRP